MYNCQPFSIPVQSADQNWKQRQGPLKIFNIFLYTNNQYDKITEKFPYEFRGLCLRQEKETSECMPSVVGYVP